MQRARFLWTLPLLLLSGAGAHAGPTAAAPRPVKAVKEAVSPATPAATADLISLDLEEAKGADLSRALGEALGMEVRVDGRLLKPVTLHLERMPRGAALDQIAAATGGAWRRTFVWTRRDGAHPAGNRSTSRKSDRRTVSLHLTKTPCRSAAALVATSVGAWAEGNEPLTGRVTLVQRQMPVEKALDRIAAQSHASWRELLALRMPSFEAQKRLAAVKTPPVPKRTPGKTLAKTPGRPRRTKYTVLAKYGAKAPPPVVVDPAVEEARAQLGVFSGIFSHASRAERLQKVRKLRASLETQIGRLEAYRPEHRRIAISFEIQQFQTMLRDYENLNADQKKDVAVLMDFVKKRLAKIQTPASGTPGTKPAANTPGTDPAAGVPDTKPAAGMPETNPAAGQQAGAGS
jgi:hypothetical protein